MSNITFDRWKTLVSAINSLDDIPSWLKEQSFLAYEDMARLPRFDMAGDGQDIVPNVSEKVLAKDYLDFLREQIILEPRGPEWGNVLKARLIALEPFVGKSIITAMFQRKPHIVIMSIDPKTGNVFLVEAE